MVDSTQIEDAYGVSSSSNESVSVDGGRFDVNISQRIKTAVYWVEDPIPIRRCSWFYKSNSDGRWNPYDEETAARLEAEYCDAVTSGRWNRRVELKAESNNRGEYITLHSPAAMMHFPSSSALSGNVDDWGQVQPQVNANIFFSPVVVLKLNKRFVLGSPDQATRRTPGSRRITRNPRRRE